MSHDRPLHDAERRRQLEQLQSQLAARASILHFAHASIAMIVGMILAGAAAKLSWDFDAPRVYWAIPVGLASVGAATYSAVRYLLGRRHLSLELRRFAALNELRRQLKVDDTSALLPQ